MIFPRIITDLPRMKVMPTELAKSKNYDAIKSRKMDTILATKRKNVSGVVIAKDSDYPIRLALHFLKEEDDPTSVIRFFVGSVIAASKVAPSKFNLENPETLELSTELMVEIANATQLEDEEEKKKALSSISMPTPSWIMEKVTAHDMSDVMELDAMEVSAYAGALCMAVTKTPSGENLDAFVSKRAALANMGVMEASPVIFGDQSDYLTVEILLKIHKASSFYIIAREVTMRSLTSHIGEMDDGSSYVFACFLFLLENTGMNYLSIIKKVIQQYPTLPNYFPHLRLEFEAASEGISRVMTLPPSERSFCKAIYGSKFIPAQYSNVANLLGVCAYILSKSEPTMANFKGGVLSSLNKDIIDDIFQEEGNVHEVEAFNNEEEEGSVDKKQEDIPHSS